ncbi:uracil-DNA glycosylase [Rickettsiella massiliensis]|uniref:uracil-DNA glycosylase n=1 Tax=Rickettsiella massiliensis TaxID=676517 RepID=UPI00029A1ED5|nr:uracil-DNA glycosylase [Rickettsiella massiliensis]
MLDQKRRHHLQQMGVVLWTTKKKDTLDNPQMTSPASQKPSPQDMMTNNVAHLDWAALEAAVARCQACSLYKTRTQPVFGSGNKQADLLVVGEAPGANEDKQGLPFVGRGGQLLTQMLLAIGLAREDIYIANILKSRPENNRDPLPQEVKACTPFLLRQIELLQPKLILAVGRIAAHFLLETNSPMSRLRGNLFYYGPRKTPLLVTYHPAYLLRSPREKRKAWQDMQCVKAQLYGSVS